MSKTHTHPITWEEFSPPPEWAKMPGLEWLRDAIASGAPRAPIAALIDMRMTGADEGVCRFEARPGPQHVNPIGVVHGGFAATVLDAACWTAVMTLSAAGESCTTLELKTSYVRAMTPATGVVACEARVIHRGRSTALAEAKMMDGQGKLLAHATSTLMILRP
jgi:uncharacterized protein (TIGR00369 family)